MFSMPSLPLNIKPGVKSDHVALGVGAVAVFGFVAIVAGFDGGLGLTELVSAVWTVTAGVLKVVFFGTLMLVVALVAALLLGVLVGVSGAAAVTMAVACLADFLPVVERALTKD